MHRQAKALPWGDTNEQSRSKQEMALTSPNLRPEESDFDPPKKRKLQKWRTGKWREDGEASEAAIFFRRKQLSLACARCRVLVWRARSRSAAWKGAHDANLRATAQVLRTRRIPLRGAQAGAACPRACTGMHGQWLTSTDDSTAAVRQMRKRARRGNGQM